MKAATGKQWRKTYELFNISLIGQGSISPQ